MVAWTYVPILSSSFIGDQPSQQRVDEAGLYLSTFKQYEHKPPDLIKERVDKDYNSVLRTSLTSISRVNKTDVETLRTSLGVCHALTLMLEFLIDSWIRNRALQI